MNAEADNSISAKAELRSAQVKPRLRGGRSQNQVVVRFWIITMTLVLVGRSALKPG